MNRRIARKIYAQRGIRHKIKQIKEANRIVSKEMKKVFKRMKQKKAEVIAYYNKLGWQYTEFKCEAKISLEDCESN